MKNNRFKVLFILLFVLLAVTTLVPPSFAATPQVKWLFSHTLPPGHPYNTSAVKMAEIVKEKSGGKFIIEVHHSGVLGWEREVLEAMQLGTIDMTWSAVGPFAVFVPCYNVFNLPFLFRDIDHMEKAFKSEAVKKLAKEAEKAGFIVMGLSAPVFRYPMNDLRPIETPQDFVGMKIRTMGVPAHIDTYKAMGANVTTTTFSELYTALQLGVVDGNENALSSLYSMKFYEVQKYITLIPVLTNNAILVVSKVKWDQLPAEYKQILREACTTVALDECSRGYIKMDEDAMQKMKEFGIKFNTPADITPFVKATEPVRQKYLKEMPKWVAEVVDSIQRIK